MIKEVAKRVIPFAIAALIGAAVAYPFASSSSLKSSDVRSADRSIEREVHRLKKENCRMKWEIRRLERMERRIMLEKALTVPEPPMAPLAPPPPPAIEAPRVPAPPKVKVEVR